LTSAFEEFARTGKLSFKSLISSILIDLTRLAAQQQLLNFLGLDGGRDIWGAIFGPKSTPASTPASARQVRFGSPLARSRSLSHPTDSLYNNFGIARAGYINPTPGGVSPNAAQSGGLNINVMNYGNDNVTVQEQGDDINIIIGTIAGQVVNGGSIMNKAIESRYGLSASRGAY